MSVVRVTVTRSGGFAGITTSAEVDDPRDAGLLAALLPPEERGGDPARDGFVYTFTVVSVAAGHDVERVVEVPGSRLPDPLRRALRDLPLAPGDRPGAAR